MLLANLHAADLPPDFEDKSLTQVGDKKVRNFVVFFNILEIAEWLR